MPGARQEKGQGKGKKKGKDGEATLGSILLMPSSWWVGVPTVMQVDFAPSGVLQTILTIDCKWASVLQPYCLTLLLLEPLNQSS